MNIPSSGHHWIEELSAKHQPKIFLQKNEYCGPIYFNHMPTQEWLPGEPEGGIYKKREYIGGRGSSVLDLLSVPGWDSKEYYIDFPEWTLKVPFHIGYGSTVFSRGKVSEEPLQNLVFIQYWMWYPSSTEGSKNAKDNAEDEKSPVIYHEGDWEMMQVAVKMDTDLEFLEPKGVTASQHYEGQSKNWLDIQVVNKYQPVVYIAGGSHATFFESKEILFYKGPALPFAEDIKIWDYTIPTMSSPEVYNLLPLEPLETAAVKWWLWKGWWGAFCKNKNVESIIRKASNGPRSPKYRGTAPLPNPEDPNYINIFDQPFKFYRDSF